MAIASEEFHDSRRLMTSSQLLALVANPSLHHSNAKHVMSTTMTIAIGGYDL